MVELLEDMPSGAIGFRVAGRLDARDYRDVLLPRLREAVQQGAVRALFVIEADVRPTAEGLWEDVKADVSLGLRHWNAWKRIALVTDVGWLRTASEHLGWLSPGRLRVFPGTELDAARAWLSADG